MKQPGRRTLKELMMIHVERRRELPDDEPLGLLFGRDLDDIFHDGKLPPSLAVSPRASSLRETGDRGTLNSRDSS